MPTNTCEGSVLRSPVWAICASPDFYQGIAKEWRYNCIIPTAASFDALLFPRYMVTSAKSAAPCGVIFYQLDWKTRSCTVQASNGVLPTHAKCNAAILSHYHIEERWVVACDGERENSRRVTRLPAQRTAADSHIKQVSKNRILITCGSGEDRIVFVVHDTAANTIV